MRYLNRVIQADLREKMVFVSGPRQVGKTNLAKAILKAHAGPGVYLNYDIPSDRKVILQETWDKDVSLLCLDEIHKNKKWKNLLKGIYDEYSDRQSILVTGSAKLDLFRKSGDALTGRYFHYRLHPIDIQEGLKLGSIQDPEALSGYLLKHGGFPESFFHPERSGRLAKNRIEQVLNEDVHDLSRVSDFKSLELLVEILREMNGGHLNYDHLSKKVGVSPPTVKKWIELLEKLYLIFLVTPFTSSSAKSYRKETKFYFFDLSLNLANEAFALENLTALSLLKKCDWMNDAEGKNYRLHYYKDANQNEIDFVITLNRKPVHLVEVKTSDDSFSKSLFLFQKKYPSVKAVQLVHHLDRVKEKEGVKMVNLSHYLAAFELP